MPTQSGLLPTGRIGPFRIERPLDDGGSARVFLGRDEQSGAAVAVKQVDPEVVHVDERYREQFRQEVDAITRLPRFCAAPVLAADVAADPPWVATEYIDAPTLAQVLRTRGRLPGPELETFAMTLAVALWVVHAHGVIHQGLKPSSVLLSQAGPRLVGFGSARSVRVGDTGRIPHPRPAGEAEALAYLAPEQVRGGPATPAVDVFAWAGLVTAAATGRPPFGASGAARRAILTGEPDLGELAGPLRDLVAEALDKQPDRRPAMVKLVRRLSAIDPQATLPQVGPPADPPAGPPAGPIAGPSVDLPAGPTTDPPTGWTRRRLVTLAVAAAAVTTTAGAVAAVRWLSAPTGAGELLRALQGHDAAVDSVAVGELAGEAIAVSTSRFDRTARLWHLASGDQLEQLATGPDSAFQAVAVGQLASGPVAVLGSPDPISIRVWDLGSGELLDLAFTDHDGEVYRAGVSSVAVGGWDGGPVVVSGGLDRTVRMWDLRTGQQLGETVQPGTTRQGLTFELAVSAGELAGAPVAVVGGQIEPPWAVAWDLSSGDQVSSSPGHVSEVRGVAVGDLAGRPVVVSGSNDRTVRVWELATGRPVGPLLTGHSRRVRAVASGDLAGTPIAVSGSDDRTLRIWDLTSGAQLGPELTGHTGAVTSVAVGELSGGPVAVSTGGDGDTTVRVWRLPAPGR